MALRELLFNLRCSVCGQDAAEGIRLRGGRLCGNCAEKLSPFFSAERRTPAEIKAHLQYRQENLAGLAVFHASKALGRRPRLLVDEAAGRFLIAQSTDLTGENPDVLELARIQSCAYRAEELRLETGGAGLQYDYAFFLTVEVSHPWFSRLEVRVNPDRIDRYGGAEYRRAERLAVDMKQALTAPRPFLCPHCGAEASPSASFCFRCGGAL